MLKILKELGEIPIIDRFFPANKKKHMVGTVRPINTSELTPRALGQNSFFALNNP